MSTGITDIHSYIVKSRIVGIYFPIKRLWHCLNLFTSRHQIFTARKRSLGQGNIFTGVCLSKGWCGRPSPQADIPPKETATEAGGTHPTGMHSCYLWKLLNKSEPKPKIYNSVKPCLCISWYCTLHQQLSLRLSWSNYWTHCLRWSWSVNRTCQVERWYWYLIFWFNCQFYPCSDLKTEIMS